MKRWPISLVIREMQLKSHMRHHYTHYDWLWNSNNTRKCWEGCGGTGNFTCCWWHVKGWCSCFWSAKQRVTIWVSNSIPRYIPKKIENICPHKNLYTNIHRNIIHNYQKYPSTDEWIQIYGISIQWDIIQQDGWPLKTLY